MDYAPTFETMIKNAFDGIYVVDANRKIVYWNPAAEKLTGFSAQEVIGSSCANNILNHVTGDGTCLCTKGCTLAATMKDGVCRESHVYMHHRDGHRVPVRVAAAPIRDEAGNIIASVETFCDDSSYNAARENIEMLAKLALLDPLTELPNRRFLDQHLTARLDEMRRLGSGVGILMIDVDRFKQINDTHGHMVGDQALRMVAKTLRGAVRGYDTVGRWAGDEFLVIQPAITDDEQLAVAERCRHLVEASFLPVNRQHLRVTVSIGAAVAQPEDDFAWLLARADLSLYDSKNLGRNRSTSALTVLPSGEEQFQCTCCAA